MESEIYVEQEMAEQRVDVRREAVIYQGGGGAVDSVNGQTGDVVLTTSDLENTSDYQTGSDVSNSINDAMSTLATVATTGDYSDLSNTPTIPTAVSQLNNDSDYQTSSEVDASILVETTAREGADNNLQRQIDAISASSDVTDIVGTYAALQAYDTSTLGDNDIIKVLQDESRNNETTYYRWSTTTQTFTLIGEEGPYYTKSEANSTFQGKLTAGTNINIDANNEISATDTTYTAGTGLSLTGTAFSADTTVLATQTDLATKQDALTAGNGIVLNGSTISADTSVLEVKGDTETYTIADTDWTALAGSAPFTYSATVTATHTIGNDTIAELLNDQAILFGTHGFAIGDITGQTVTIFAIGAPSSSVSLKVNYKG